MAENVKGILLRTEHLRGLRMLEPGQVGELVLALFADAGEGEMPRLDDLTRVVFELIAPSGRRANDAYASRCAANAENGRKGGRPRKRAAVELSLCAEGEEPTGFSGQSENPDETKRSETELKDSPLIPPAGKREAGTERGFVRPSVEEVQAYCDERGNGIRAERFVDYYAAQGWKLSNGRPLRDWKAAVRNWESRDAGRGDAAAGRSEASAGRVVLRGGLCDAERRQAHNDRVCREVSAELEAMGGPF